MSTSERPWKITEAQWAALVARVAAADDVLEDGAIVRVEPGSDGAGPELYFYATRLNKPLGWRYPFAETIDGSEGPVAFVGRAWHDTERETVELEVVITAAAQALLADYESGVDDMDYVAYEQSVESAVRGGDADREWLYAEFGRLVAIGAF